MAGPRGKQQFSLFLLTRKRKKRIEILGNSKPISKHDLHFNTTINLFFRRAYYVRHIKQHIHYGVKGKPALIQEGVKVISELIGLFLSKGRLSSQPWGKNLLY